MMSKPELVAACRKLALQLSPVDDFLSLKLCRQLAEYERNGELGGAECAKIAKTLGEIRLSLALQGVPLAQIGGLWLSGWGETYTLESQAWEAYAF